ncbi:phosphate ABC transporter substrate-binding protein [bacterium 336/3]|nr:phosphate ABC transporter substrate-binding protein [bacterium 336/3]
MKKVKCLKKAFGVNEWGLVDYPIKISNVKVSRVLYGNDMGCSRCFPHGYETTNSTIGKRQRNWKKFRKTKWK